MLKDRPKFNLHANEYFEEVLPFIVLPKEMEVMDKHIDSIVETTKKTKATVKKIEEVLKAPVKKKPIFTGKKKKR